MILLLVLACDSTSDNDGATYLCTDDAAPVQLASRVDDEDGDGDPIDEDFPRVDDEDDDIADHTWVRDGHGVYHLFFHTEGLYAPSEIHHYTSRDLASIEYAGVALTVGPGAWDSDAVWAPHVISVGDTWYMFYTGVEGSGASATQRIGLAISRDLVTWTRIATNRCAGTSGDGCIYDCREGWTTAAGSNPNDRQCRDPFVMWDAGTRRWLLFATARSTNGFGVVTIAASDDVLTWEGSGYVDATRRLAGGVGAQTTGGQAENPFVIAEDGLNYLLFTDWQDMEDTLTVATPRTMVQLATSPTLANDDTGSTNWVYRGYTPDPGVNAIEALQWADGAAGGGWILSEAISNKYSGYPRRQRRQLILRCMNIASPGTFTTSAFVPTPPP